MKRKHRHRIIFWVLLLLLLLAAATLLVRYENIRFQKSLYPLGYSEIVTREAKENALPPALVYSVILAESDFNAEAKSHAGAMGLMQLTPDTFEWLRRNQPEAASYTDKDLYTPEINIRYGCRFLGVLLKKYGNRKTALCAYNAGMGKIDSWLKDPKVSADGRSLKNIPYPETRSYVVIVEQNYEKYKSLYGLE